MLGCAYAQPPFKCQDADGRTVYADRDCESLGLRTIGTVKDSVSIAPGNPVPASATAAFTQQELDQLLAPVALYPDPLLSQVLMAATYPLEVAEAARWARANSALHGEDAVRAADAQPWDPSVKSLLAFPQVLFQMAQQLDWTQRLGNAVLAQPLQVMDTVQGLRRRAEEAGNLRPSEQVRIDDQGGTIAVAPANPALVYVPAYDPLAVYGTWWWPGYPPVQFPRRPANAPRAGLAWGAGVALPSGFFFGKLDWARRRVETSAAGTNYSPGQRAAGTPEEWRHDAAHRRAVPYRSEAVRQQFESRSAPPAAAQARREFRGREGPADTAPAPKAFEGIRAGGEKTREFSARGQTGGSGPAAPAQERPREPQKDHS